MGWATEGSTLAVWWGGPATAWGSPRPASGLAGEQGAQLGLDHQVFSSQEVAGIPQPPC